MALPNPSLGVIAQPVSTYVQPAPAAAQLYDQQSVNLALMFSESFSNLSISAARFAGAFKQDQNQADLQQGQFLVNNSRNSYKTLVANGEINPAENPWLAIGAQQASGTIEGLNARAAFQQRYNEQAAQNPDFFKDSSHFDALAYTFSKEANDRMGDSAYLSSSYYESFNPFMANMGMRHLENVTQEQHRVIANSIDSLVYQTITDMQDSQQAPEIQASFIQRLDNMGAIVGNRAVNNRVIDNFVELAASGDVAGIVDIFNSINVGTGALAQTSYAQQKLAVNQGRIDINNDRLAVQKRADFEAWGNRQIEAWQTGSITQEAVLQSLEGSSQEQRDWMEGQFQTARTNTFTAGMLNQQKAVETLIESSAVLESPPTTTKARRRSTEQEAFVNAQTELINRMRKPGSVITEMQQELYLQKFEEQWMKMAPKRELQRVQEAARGYFEGIPGTPGALAVFNSDLDTVIQGTGTWDGGAARSSLDAMLPTMGISPEKTKSAYLAAAAQYKEILAQKEAQLGGAEGFNGTLNEHPKDTLAVRAKKDGLRARFLFTRLSIGAAFDDNTDAVGLNRILVQTLNSSVEKKLDPRLRDALSAYTFGKQMRPMDTVFALDPKSQGGSVLIKYLDLIADKAKGGMDIHDAAVDVSQAQQLLGEKVDPNNPWAFTDILNGQDAPVYSAQLRDVRETLGITSGDSAVFMASETHKILTKHLREGYNAKAAFVATRDELQDPAKYMVINGAFLPREDFPPDMPPSRVKYWLEQNYSKDAKLVVVGLNPNGQRVYGIRNSDDVHFADVLVTAKDIVVDGKQEVLAYLSWMQKKRQDEQAAENRRIGAYMQSSSKM